MNPAIAEHLDEWIAARLEGRLSADETAQFDLHLKEHAEARRLLDSSTDAHGRLIAAFESSKPDAALEDRLLQKFLQSTMKQQQDFLLLRKRPDSFWRRVLTIAVPSVIMLFVGMALSRIVVFEERPAWSIPESEPKKEDMSIGMPGTAATAGSPAPTSLPADPLARIEALLQTRKQFRDATLSLEVSSWEQAAQKVQEFTLREQGEIESADLRRQLNGRASGTMVAKVSRDKLNLLLESVRTLGELRAQRLENSVDPPGFKEAETHLHHLRETEQRLAALQSVEATTELADVRHEIAVTEEAIKRWQALAGAATAALSFTEKDATDAAYQLIETAKCTLLSPDVSIAFEAAKTEAVRLGAEIIDAHVTQEDGKQSAALNLVAPPEKVKSILDAIARLGRVRTLERAHKRESMTDDPTLASGRTEQAPVRVQITIEQDDRAEKNITLQLFTKEVASACEEAKSLAAAAGATVVASVVSGIDTSDPSAAMRIRVYSDREARLVQDLRRLGYASLLNITRDTSTPGQVVPVLLEITIRATENPVQQTVVRVESPNVSGSIDQIKQAASSSSYQVHKLDYSSGNGSEKGTLLLRGPAAGASKVMEELQKMSKVLDVTNERQEDAASRISKEDLAEIEVRLQSPKPERIEVSFGYALQKNLMLGLGSVGRVLKGLAVGMAYVLPWAVIAWVGLWLIRRRLKT